MPEPDRQAAEPEPNYSAGERARLAVEFIPIAKSYRRRKRQALIAVWSFVAFALLIRLFWKTEFSVHFLHFLWAIVVFWCMAAVVALALASARLICPGCKDKLEALKGLYCPECGSRSLEPGAWLRQPHCTSCNRTLRSGKGRYYKIRACNHCGLFLDLKGF